LHIRAAARGCLNREKSQNENAFTHTSQEYKNTKKNPKILEIKLKTLQVNNLDVEHYYYIKIYIKNIDLSTYVLLVAGCVVEPII